MNSSLLDNALKTLVFFCSVLAFLANAESIYQQSMLRLNAESNSASQIQTLVSFKGKPLITSFFMPNCRWCQRQHKVLKKIQQTCPQIQTVMLGVQGSKQKLRKELQREKNTFPAYLTNNNIIKAIGAQSPVPMMLFFNEQGTLVFKTVGFTSAEKLTALIEQHKLNTCLT
ncbi:MAG: thioredoxin family protein [Colwellia sp.]